MPRRPALLEAFALAAIVLAAAYLRLGNGAESPGWYTDEGTHLDIAYHLLSGQAQYQAVRGPALLFARLPLFDLLLAGLLRLAGAGPGGDWAAGMAVLRAFTGALGVVTVVLLYALARRAGGPRGSALALLAALVYAVYPPAVIYSRLGFSYNLLAPLLLLALWGVWAYLDLTEPRPSSLSSMRARASGYWPLYGAAAALGLGAVSDLWMLAALPALLLAAAWRSRRAALWAGAVALLPWAIYAGAWLALAPADFLFDVRFTFLRLGGRPWTAQMALLAGNYAALLAQDGWLALGLLGLFRLCPPRLRHLALLFLAVPFALIGRSAALVSLGFYYMVPLLPLLALGLAALLRDAAAWLARAVEMGLGPGVQPGSRRAAAAALALALLGAPLAVALGTGLGQVRGGFTTAIDPFLLSPPDARAAAAFITARARPEDVVIASPGLAWLVPARAADFQLSLLYAGQPLPYLPADLPRERFAFSPDYRQARFVVVDNLWRNWAVFDVPGAAALLAEVEQWPLVFRAGELWVYEREAGAGN